MPVEHPLCQAGGRGTGPAPRIPGPAWAEQPRAGLGSPGGGRLVWRFLNVNLPSCLQAQQIKLFCSSPPQIPAPAHTLQPRCPSQGSSSGKEQIHSISGLWNPAGV